MPFNGSGTYNAPSSPGAFNPAVSGGSATPSAWNTLLADLATALSTTVTSDGQSTITQDIPFNDKRITGLGDATTDTDALNGRSSWRIFQQQDVSAAAVIDFIDIPSTVNNIMCVYEIRPSTDAVNIGLRTYDAAGNLDTGATDYAWWSLSVDTTPASSAAADTTSEAIALAAAVDNGVTGVGGTLTAMNIQAATYTKFVYSTNYLDFPGTNGIGVTGFGQRLEAAAITGIRIYTSSGTVTGKATLYVSI